MHGVWRGKESRANHELTFSGNPEAGMIIGNSAKRPPYSRSAVARPHGVECALRRAEPSSVGAFNSMKVFRTTRWVPTWPSTCTGCVLRGVCPGGSPHEVDQGRGRGVLSFGPSPERVHSKLGVGRAPALRAPLLARAPTSRALKAMSSAMIILRATRNERCSPMRQRWQPDCRQVLDIRRHRVARDADQALGSVGRGVCEVR